MLYKDPEDAPLRRNFIKQRHLALNPELIVYGI